MTRMPDNRETILVIDSNETFAEVLAAALTRRGFRAIAALNMDETLRLLRNEVPSRAILDLRLGKTSGLKLIPVLKATNPDMRIVALTGFASLETAATALRLGAVSYLAKPADADEIVAAFEVAAR